MNSAYADPELFIHQELLRRCEPVVRSIPAKWNEQQGKIFPVLLIWPADTIKTSRGEDFAGVVFAQLPKEEDARMPYVHEAAQQCHAYALLLTEQTRAHVRVHFESIHGTKTWTFPLRSHGDIQVLGQPVEQVNSHPTGVLWVN